MSLGYLTGMTGVDQKIKQDFLGLAGGDEPWNPLGNTGRHTNSRPQAIVLRVSSEERQPRRETEEAEEGIGSQRRRQRFPTTWTT